MKFEPDTEMERLLRRHARRKAAAAPLGSEAARDTSSESHAATHLAGGAHLDADEMNAYAEGALPDATRARYFSHLADCDECRTLVTKLTLAANVVTAPSVPATVAAAAPSSSWREWLAALFSPPVLRYGVPAFALLAVMVVAFVATRERRSEVNLVAQHEQRESNTRPTPVSEEQQAAQPTTGTSAAATEEGRALNENANAADFYRRQPDATTETSQGEKPAEKKEVEAQQNMPVQQSQPKPAEPQAAPGADVTGQQRNPDEAVTVAKAQPPPPVTAAPAARPPADNDRRAEEEDARKSGDFGAKAKTARPATTTGSGGVVARDEATANNQTAATRRAQKSSGTRERAGRSNRADDTSLSNEAAAGPDNKDDRAGETRSAGGRQFRRQGGAWVDTAYNSSRATVNVARGSEQYRALVADEPGIRTIANILGGTVIVVWKNRAYRIY